jgi:hypothetical protein
MHIEHQPNATNYETVEEWLQYNDEHKFAEITREDRAEMLRTNEIWIVQWYPITPVGFYAVAAATLDKALQLANEVE